MRVQVYCNYLPAVSRVGKRQRFRLIVGRGQASDCRQCRHQEQTVHGIPHRCWLTGSIGPRNLDLEGVIKKD
jgi:hypothetical protein